MKRKIFDFLLGLLLCFGLAFAASAAQADADAAADGRLMAVVHLEPVDRAALKDAVQQGADYVSVRVNQLPDGQFALTDADDTFLLSDAAALLDADTGLLLDFDWNERAALCDWVEAQGLETAVCLRTTASAKKITAFLNERPTDVRFIGVYRGNIIFNAVSHLKALTAAGQPVVQYQSKNYFNVAYETLFPSILKRHDAARAMAATYTPVLCGQRSDDISGWDDLIQKGYSVIETGNLDGLSAYIAQCKTQRKALQAALENAQKIDAAVYDGVSQKNLSAALQAAEAAAQNPYAALSVLQGSSAALKTAVRNLTLPGTNDVQKGSLHVTAGKIIAIIVFGGLIFGGQVYVFQMRKKKEAP